jgi:hypothetical protein
MNCRMSSGTRRLREAEMRVMMMAKMTSLRKVKMRFLKRLCSAL